MSEEKRDISNKTENKRDCQKGNLSSKKRALNESASGSHTTPQVSKSGINQQEDKTLENSDIALTPRQRCPRCGQPYRIGDTEINATAQQRDIPTNWIELVKWLYGKLTGRSKKAATCIIVIAILVAGVYKIWPHIEWRIRDIKFRMTVENTSKKEVGLSENGRYTVYEEHGGKSKSLFSGHLFRVIRIDPNSVSSDNIIFQPGKTLIQVKFKNTKPVWDVYKNGHTYVDLEFLTTDLMSIPESRIPFNAGTLKSNEVIRNLVLADDEAMWTSSCIKAYFAEPQNQNDTLARNVIGLLRQGGSDRRKLFKIGDAPEDFDIRKQQFVEYKKEHPKDQTDEEEAQQWENKPEVRISVGRDDPNDKLMVHLEDVQNKINEEFSIEYRSDQDWLSIDRTLEIVNRTIVSKYHVRGRIEEIYGDSTKRYAYLNVGSMMGVWEGMKFNVFSPGTNEPIGTLTITVVHHGEGASGELGEQTLPGLVKEGFRVESAQE